MYGEKDYSADESEEECVFCHCEANIVGDAGEGNLREILRPCRCIGRNLGLHYMCLVNMIKAYKDKPCGACNTKYTDPRIRRVSKPLWHWMLTPSFMQEFIAFVFIYVLVHHLFFSHRGRVIYIWSENTVFVGFLLALFLVFYFTASESIRYWRRHEGADLIEFDHDTYTEYFSLAETDQPPAQQAELPPD